MKSVKYGNSSSDHCGWRLWLNRVQKAQILLPLNALLSKQTLRVFVKFRYCLKLTVSRLGLTGIWCQEKFLWLMEVFGTNNIFVYAFDTFAKNWIPMKVTNTFFFFLHFSPQQKHWSKRVLCLRHTLTHDPRPSNPTQDAFLVPLQRELDSCRRRKGRARTDQTVNYSHRQADRKMNSSSTMWLTIGKEELRTQKHWLCYWNS